MDDPDTTWPYWKFGLKKADLFSKLHDEYNTHPSNIQDAEAFHHDVFEIANEANTTDEFYRLLGKRKAQRLDELNKSLEYAACEIIGNPSFIGTEKWEYAVQLFRSKALDSLVRFFASYLPETSANFPIYPAFHSGPLLEPRDCHDCHDTPVETRKPFFDDRSAMTDEPLELCPATMSAHLPPSPRSMTMGTDSSAPSQIDSIDESWILDCALTPPRTLSFSDSECDCPYHRSPTTDSQEKRVSLCHDESPAMAGCDASKIGAGVREEKRHTSVHEPTLPQEHGLDCETATGHTLESELPTPRLDQNLTWFLESSSAPPRRRHRSASPSRSCPISQTRCHVPHSDPRDEIPAPNRRQKNVDLYLVRKGSRSLEGRCSRVRKAPWNPHRSRPVERGRRGA